jgi:putative Mn2+ efflux pump MntP
MNTTMTLLIALGLALDAFSVAVVGGVTTGRTRLRDAFRMAVFFGLFQAVMPLIGWQAGGFLSDFITGVDHWIAFVLLCLIGSHMILESIKPASKAKSFNLTNIRILFLLSIATSIDALAVGISMAFVELTIVRTVLVIGGVTFVLSFVGYYIGRKIGMVFGNNIRILGGVILIGIGLRILIEHLR